jgi:RNA polymerase sigma factor (sigma-70 family)
VRTAQSPRVEPSDFRHLVQDSLAGDENAWIELVRRLVHLVTKIARQYRLSPADTDDVSQTVWLRLVEHLADIREPAALPGWVATTAKHECQQTLRRAGRAYPVDPLTDSKLDRSDHPDLDVDLIEEERLRVLRAGVAELPAHHRELIELLATDPPVPYAEISRRLGMSIGSIGPTRSRILQRLRETSPVKSYLGTTRGVSDAGGDRHALAELE